MLLLAVLLVVSFFPGFAISLISAPNCSSTWEWSFNSLGQNACTVAAFMMSTCNAGSFTVDPLQPGGSYSGPGGTDNSNLCKCSTVGYSLISACAGCQEGNWISWSEHVTNCTKILPPSRFPNPVPSGTRVPRWALLDVTMENFWNASESNVVGDSPEVDPGGILGPLGLPVTVSASVPTSSFNGPSSITTTTTTPALIRTHKSNRAAIIGAIIGGIAAISILVAALFFYWRRRRSLVPSPVFDGDFAFDQHMDRVTGLPILSQETVSSCFPEASTSSLRPCYQDYPDMHSEFEVTSPPPAYYISGQVPSSISPNRSLYTVGTMPSSQVHGYHSLPTSRFHLLNRSQ